MVDYSSPILEQDAISQATPVLFQDSAEPEPVSLQGLAWPVPRHSRSTRLVLAPVLLDAKCGVAFRVSVRRCAPLCAAKRREAAESARMAAIVGDETA